MSKCIVIPPDKLSHGQFLYEQTQTPMAEIAAALGISSRTLADRVKALGWQPRRGAGTGFLRRVSAPAVTSGTPVEAAGDDSLGYEQRVALLTRLFAAVKRQVDGIDSILPPKSADEAERSARALASLFRTLRQMPPPMEAPALRAPAESDNDAEMPRDLDELRRELCQKLEAFVAGQSDPVPGGTEGD